MQIQEVLTYEANFTPVQQNHLTITVDEERFIGGIHKFWQPWDGQVYLNTQEHGWQAFITVDGGSVEEVDVAALHGVSFGSYQQLTHSFRSETIKISGDLEEKTPKKRLNLGRKTKIADTTVSVEEAKKAVKELQTTKATTAVEKDAVDPKKTADVTKKVEVKTAEKSVKNTKA